jgi:hypothetical protein
MDNNYRAYDNLNKVENNYKMERNCPYSVLI